MIAHPDEIRLTLPAFASYGRVARLAIAGLAARNGFSYDEVEDIRIAIGEVFTALVDHDDFQVTFGCRLDDDGLAITGSRVPPSTIAPLGELSQQILAAVVSEVSVDVDVGSISFAKRPELRA